MSAYDRPIGRWHVAATALVMTAAPAFAGTIVDCNNNGVDDAADIASGTSTDADGNGWHEGTWFFLNDLVRADTPWTLRNFSLEGSINDAGQITGDGLNADVTDVNGTNPAVHAYIMVELIAGDLDEDGVVGITDLLALLAGWGDCPPPCPPACLGDLDGDCQVGITDLLTLLASWTTI